MVEGILVAAAILAGAWALGRRLYAPWRGAWEAPLLAGVCATALGMGALALLTLGLGLAGWFGPSLFRTGLLAGALLAAWDLYRDRKALASWATGLKLDGLALAQAAGATCLLLPLAAGLLAPPSDYDALEYHLGAPAAYLRQGRISFLEDNIYASFPENQEMLYLAGLAATGTHAGGAAAAKALNLACWALAALALLGLGRRHASPRAGGWAALALLASPWVLLTGGWLVYNEPALALFSLLAAALAWEGQASLAGLMAGLAFGVKYPAALFLLLPLALGLAFRSPRKALVFTALALAAASPWLLKNLAATGNPVYPLLEGHTAWDAAHAPGPRDWEHLAASLDGLGSGMLLCPALLVFLPFGWFQPSRKVRAAALAWILVGVALWFLFTHRVDRFCLPFLPAACFAVGVGVEAMACHAGGWLGRCVIGVVALVAAATGILQAADGLGRRADPWGADATYSTAAIREVNRLPAGSRVLFVGEAETFYVRLDGAVRVVAPTVFDAKPFEAAEDLKAQGFTHVYLNWPELVRLQATYGDRKRGYSRLLTSHPGERPGPEDNFFDRLEAEGRATRVWEDRRGRFRILALR